MATSTWRCITHCKQAGTAVGDRFCPPIWGEHKIHIKPTPMKLKSLCVYCGSSPGLGACYVEAAEDFGRLIAAEGITLVYGGGNVGLMGALADSVLGAGGKVIGVIPDRLVTRDVAHSGVTAPHRVRSEEHTAELQSP